MSRFAILSVVALLAFAACVRRGTPSAKAEGGACAGCHAAHHVTERSCESCHRGDEHARRIEIAHNRLLRGKAAQHRSASSPAVVEGGRLVAALACRRCHVIGGNGNRLATSLDQIGGRREQSALARSIGEPVSNMPSFGLDEPQAESIIAYLLHHADRNSIEAPYRVHFAGQADDDRSTFDERCGGCHRALLEGGPAGRGSAGPNLSGLMTAHYPLTAPGETVWTRASLRDWLREPRRHRRLTTMRPLQLEGQEVERLLEELEPLSGADHLQTPH